MFRLASNRLPERFYRGGARIMELDRKSVV